MKNVPKLRFKEFTEEWEEDKLSNLSELIKDGTHGTHENVENGVVLLSAKDIKNGKIQIQKDCRKISLDDFQKIHKNYTLQNDDLLLSIVGTIGEVGIIENYNNNYTFQRSVGIVRLKKQKLNPSYCFQYFKTEIFQNILKNKANSSAQAGVYLGELSKININFSSFQEQQKIADFLSCVDTKISLTEEKLENLKIYKKGIMQKIFSQEIRFKDKNGNDYPEWEEKRLGDLVEEYIEKTTVNNQYQVLSSTATGIYLQEEYFKKQTASENNIGYRIIPKNYFTYRSMSDTGNFTFNIQKIIEKGIVSPAYPVFKNKQEVILKEYLYFTLNNSKKIIEQILVLKEGGTRYALSFSKFLKLKLDVPILEEQQKIADFLSSIDDKIEKTENKLNELKKFKKGLLQKMFV